MPGKRPLKVVTSQISPQSKAKQNTSLVGRSFDTNARHVYSNAYFYIRSSLKTWLMVAPYHTMWWHADFCCCYLFLFFKTLKCAFHFFVSHQNYQLCMLWGFMSKIGKITLQVGEGYCGGRKANTHDFKLEPLNNLKGHPLVNNPSSSFIFLFPRECHVIRMMLVKPFISYTNNFKFSYFLFL